MIKGCKYRPVEPDKEFVRNFKDFYDCPRNLKSRGIDSQPDEHYIGCRLLKRQSKWIGTNYEAQVLLINPKSLQLRIKMADGFFIMV